MLLSVYVVTNNDLQWPRKTEGKMLGGENGNSRGQMQQLLNRSIQPRYIRMASQDLYWAEQRYREDGLDILSEVVITLKKV